jgi:hypothetical protein
VAGVKQQPKKKRRRIRHFYWQGKLHKVLRISYPENLVEAWCYQDAQSVALLYTDFKRRSGLAIRTGEVAKLLRCERKTIFRALAAEEIRRPETAYTLDDKMEDTYMWWSEKDVLELHEALLSHHRGRPRKDGKITPRRTLPTAGEVRAFFRNENTLYIRSDDGALVPIFDR